MPISAHEHHQTEEPPAATLACDQESIIFSVRRLLILPCLTCFLILFTFCAGAASWFLLFSVEPFFTPSLTLDSTGHRLSASLHSRVEIQLVDSLLDLFCSFHLIQAYLTRLRTRPHRETCALHHRDCIHLRLSFTSTFVRSLLKGSTFHAANNSPAQGRQTNRHAVVCSSLLHSRLCPRSLSCSSAAPIARPFPHSVSTQIQSDKNPLTMMRPPKVHVLLCFVLMPAVIAAVALSDFTPRATGLTSNCEAICKFL